MLPIDVAAEPRAFKSLLPPPWVWACLCVAGLVAGLVVGPRHVQRGFPETKVDVARLATRQYANAAYAAWRAQYRCSKCPLELWQLADFMDKQDTRDPWGREYQLTCGDDRIYVMSLGEDGVSNTSDDIWSHQ